MKVIEIEYNFLWFDQIYVIKTQFRLPKILLSLAKFTKVLWLNGGGGGLGFDINVAKLISNAHRLSVLLNTYMYLYPVHNSGCCYSYKHDCNM